MLTIDYFLVEYNFEWTVGHLCIVLYCDGFVCVCFRFRIDNTDHIIDVNKGNIPFEYDQVNIICPVYMPGTHEEDAEKYIIYNVSRSVGTYFCVCMPEFKLYNNGNHIM